MIKHKGFLYVICLISTQKNVDNLHRLRCSRYRQTPNVLKRVNAHAVWRELLLLFLYICLENLPIFRRQESKSGYSSYMSFLYFSQPIGISVIRFYIILYCLTQFIWIHSHIPEGRNAYQVALNVIDHLIVVVDNNRAIRNLSVTQQWLRKATLRIF